MAVDGDPPPAIRRPDAKEERYDRSTRVWGSAGQKALEDTHVCLFSATGAGSETLKNLVLPGIGRITVVDGERVTYADLGRNFFVEEQSVGKERAEVVAGLLQEMNPQNVRCSSIPVSPAVLLDDRPDFLTSEQVHCVITADLPEALLRRVAERCEEAGCALVSLQTCGMIGILRVFAAEHNIVDADPDQKHVDLRVLNPFPALQDYFDRCGDPASETDPVKHAHIPWPVLVAWYVKQWQKEACVASLPTAKTRSAVASMIMQGRIPMKPEEQSEEARAAGIPPGPREEENFKEAYDWMRLYRQKPRPDTLERLFSAPQAANPTPESSTFWVLVAAVREFVKVHTVLPVTGIVPDMTSSTAGYITLAKVYRDEAARDRQWVKDKAAAILQGLGREPADLTDELVASVCRNASVMCSIDYKPLARELTGGNPDLARETARSQSDCDSWWYVVWRASERFFSAHGRYPGDTGVDYDGSIASDTEELDKEVRAVLSESDCAVTIPTEFAKEWCRAGKSELHTVASVLGGIAAQEVIKIVTRQRVPINNTLIFNGILGRCSTLRV
eukprot:TRINITY_DN30801_c0_g1_i1.p1 TRINITY_DN30801_c0_g1~~TRINITY_DN30801_c0_g1_i1.p1  ORF type:complete len:590 (+),score=161.30 TRINITY_DN30801_c0_g1_i1:90-1772(+)